MWDRASFRHGAGFEPVAFLDSGVVDVFDADRAVASIGTASADQPGLWVSFVIRDRLIEQRDDMTKEGQL
jgi:hypothetical protein